MKIYEAADRAAKEPIAGARSEINRLQIAPTHLHGFDILRLLDGIDLDSFLGYRYERAGAGGRFQPRHEKSGWTRW